MIEELLSVVARRSSLLSPRSQQLPSLLLLPRALPPSLLPLWQASLTPTPPDYIGRTTTSLVCPPPLLPLLRLSWLAAAPPPLYAPPHIVAQHAHATEEEEEGKRRRRLHDKSGQHSPGAGGFYRSSGQQTPPPGGSVTLRRAAATLPRCSSFPRLTLRSSNAHIESAAISLPGEPSPRRPPPHRPSSSLPFFPLLPWHAYFFFPTSSSSSIGLGIIPMRISPAASLVAEKMACAAQSWDIDVGSE